MSHLSNHAESGLLSHLFRADTYAKPSTIAVALCSTVPTDASTGASMGELPNANGYARVNLGAPSNSLFSNITQDALGSGYTSNLAQFSFPVSTADIGWASGVAVLDNAGYGSGNIIYCGALPSPQFIQNNTTITFPVDGLRLYLH